MKQSKKARPIAPKDGLGIKAVLAGGSASMGRSLSQKLRDLRGIEVTQHREMDKPRVMGRPLPPGTDLVIVLLNAVGGRRDEAVIERAEAAKIPWIGVQSKWGNISHTLWYRFGITATNATGAKTEEPAAPTTPEPPTAPINRVITAKKETAILLHLAAIRRLLPKDAAMTATVTDTRVDYELLSSPGVVEVTGAIIENDLTPER